METGPRAWIAVLRHSHERLASLITALNPERLTAPSACCPPKRCCGWSMGGSTPLTPHRLRSVGTARCWTGRVRSFPDSEPGGDQPGRVPGAAPGQRDPGPAVPVVVDHQRLIRRSHAA